MLHSHMSKAPRLVRIAHHERSKSLVLQYEDITAHITGTWINLSSLCWSRNPLLPRKSRQLNRSDPDDFAGGIGQRTDTHHGHYT
jgi:hypothetical protein